VDRRGERGRAIHAENVRQVLEFGQNNPWPLVKDAARALHLSEETIRKVVKELRDNRRLTNEVIRPKVSRTAKV